MNPRSLRLFIAALVLTSALGIVLLTGRIWRTESLRFAFLVWNLFLAWLPLGCALLAARWLKPGRSSWPGVLYLVAWLLFFPNAPYIFTDFVHLRLDSNAPWWFDLGVLTTFALTGLMLGLLSLMVVHHAVTAWAGPVRGWLVVAGSALLSGFGVYLGRFQRWNSWDVLADPAGLLADVLHRVMYPMQHVRTVGVTLIFGLLVGALYLALYSLTLREPSPEPKS